MGKALEIELIASVGNVEIEGRIGGAPSDAGHAAYENKIDAMLDKGFQQGMSLEGGRSIHMPPSL